MTPYGLRIESMTSTTTCPTNLLFGHGHDGCLVHLDVVNAHPTEYGEGLHEILVVRGKWQIVKLKKNIDSIRKCEL